MPFSIDYVDTQQKKKLKVRYSCCGISIGHYKVALENMVVENWMHNNIPYPNIVSFIIKLMLSMLKWIFVKIARRFWLTQMVKL